MTLVIKKNMKKLNNILKTIIDSNLDSFQKIPEQENSIKNIIQILIKARDNKRSIFTMGNGGSGSTASHFTSDLLKTAITKNNNRFSAFSLTDNLPVILAWSNDSSFENIFEEQLKNHLKKNDILIGFSGSGTSKNLISAFRYAKKIGATCIGITGMKGGNFPKICDYCFFAPSNNMLMIESIHLTLCHIIVESIRKLGTPKFNYD